MLVIEFLRLALGSAGSSSTVFSLSGWSSCNSVQCYMASPACVCVCACACAYACAVHLEAVAKAYVLIALTRHVHPE